MEPEKLQVFKGLLKSYYISRFGQFRLLPHDNSSSLPLHELWVNQEIEKPHLGAQTSGVEDVIREALHDSQVVIIKGEPGMGKTAVVQWLAYQYGIDNFKDYDILLAANLCSCTTGSTLFDMTTKWLCERIPQLKTELTTEDLQLFRDYSKTARSPEANKLSTLLVLDGLEEAPEHLQGLEQLLQTDDGYMPFDVVLTTRPHKISDIKVDCQAITLRGFNKEKQQEFAKKFFARHSNTPENMLHACVQQFKDALEAQPNLRIICAIPMFLKIVCTVLGGSSQPITISSLSQMYESLLKFLFYHYNEKSIATAAIDLQNWTEDHRINQVIKLAFHETMLNRFDINADAISEENKAEWLAMGLMVSETVTHPKSLRRKSAMKFLHTTFQEYLTAVALLMAIEHDDSNTINEFINYMNKGVKERCQLVQVAAFLIGLAQDDMLFVKAAKLLDQGSMFHIGAALGFKETACTHLVDYDAALAILIELETVIKAKQADGPVCPERRTLASFLQKQLDNHLMLSQNADLAVVLDRVIQHHPADQILKLSDRCVIWNRHLFFCDRESIGMQQRISSGQVSQLTHALYAGRGRNMNVFFNLIAKADQNCRLLTLPINMEAGFRCEISPSTSQLVRKLEHLSCAGANSAVSCIQIPHCVKRVHNVLLRIFSNDQESDDCAVDLSCAILLKLREAQSVSIRGLERHRNTTIHQFHKVITSIPWFVRYLLLRGIVLDGDSFNCLIQKIPTWSKLFKLSIDVCTLDSIQVQRLVKAASLSPSIAQLSMDRVDQVGKYDTFCKIMPILTGWKRLNKLSFHYVNFEPSALELLVQNLYTMPNLKELCIIGAKFTPRHRKIIESLSNSLIVRM